MRMRLGLGPDGRQEGGPIVIGVKGRDQESEFGASCVNGLWAPGAPQFAFSWSFRGSPAVALASARIGLILVTLSEDSCPLLLGTSYALTQEGSCPAIEPVGRSLP